MKLIKCLFYSIFLLASFHTLAADPESLANDSRYVGAWKGTWLEGMSSGKVSLEITRTGGEFSFTARPNFGTQPASITKMVNSEKQFAFVVSGEDGQAIRFELKPSDEFEKLKGKAYYDNLHLELELLRAP